MDIFFDIIKMSDNEIDSFIEKRIVELDIADVKKEISLSEDEGNIYPNWINTNTVYLPSGIRSKGFKIDVKFLKDFVNGIREQACKLNNLETKLTEDLLINWLLLAVVDYFGASYDETKRKEIYGYGSLNSIGETLNLSDLKGLNVSRCAERSAALNQIFNFYNIESSLVLSDANDVGHAYCLVNRNGKYFIVDPNFYGKAANGKGIPYIFEIDPQSNLCTFDPAIYGDNRHPKVDYKFPNQKVPGIKL